VPTAGDGDIGAALRDEFDLIELFGLRLKLALTPSRDADVTGECGIEPAELAVGPTCRKAAGRLRHSQRSVRRVEIA